MTSAEPELSPLKRALVEIRSLRAQLAEAEASADTRPVAVIGVGMRFPGGIDDPASLWDLLRTGGDVIGDVPPDRWDTATHPARGGFLDDVAGFDPGFFGISPREADAMDPQQRVLLEVAWEALEDGGIGADRLAGGDTGVFVGIANNDYMRMLLADPGDIDPGSITGNTLSVAAGRIAYLLGVHGPTMALDTACSSSLVAVHLAIAALRRGECSTALAGGVNLMLSPEVTINFTQQQMLAADGRCKTFDAAADGYVRSEGCGVVALKLLDDAIRDGDRIRAVIRGSAVNHDGRSGGLTAPSGPAQERVIAAALRDAGVTPAEVDYVEAHGTGTSLGDPIEVRSLVRSLADAARTAPIRLGSVKTNLGHTETAAGIAGMLKTIAMLEHGAIPAHLHLDELNPHLHDLADDIDIVTRHQPWPRGEGGRIAGVSSFGLSGTNAHVILAEAPAITVDEPSTTRSVDVITASARSVTALDDLTARYAADLTDVADLRAFSWAANVGRTQHNHRRAIVAGSRDAAIAALGDAASADAVVASGIAHDTERRVAFLFTGHGAQRAGMGVALYDDEPVFRAAIDACDAHLGTHLDHRLVDVFASDELLATMTHAQPALFSLQYALIELWRSWGVTPGYVAGHSGGEYAAAVCAGVVELEDALDIVAARGRLMDTLPQGGAMAALFVAEATVQAAVADHPTVGIAAVNGPATTVISGDRAAVEAVIIDLALDADDLRWLPIAVGAHSHLVEPILDDFEAVVARASLRRPGIAMVSSATGDFEDAEFTQPGYWRRHLRAPVRFADVFSTLQAEGVRTFIELGPEPVLIGQGRRAWPDDQANWISSLDGDTDDLTAAATAVAQAWCSGVPVDWSAFDAHGAPPVSRARRSLPRYPWERRRHWAHTSRRTARRITWDELVATAGTQADQGPLGLAPQAYATRFAALDRLAVTAMGRAVDELDRSGAVVIGSHRSLVERWRTHLADRPDDGWANAHERAREELGSVSADIAPLADYVMRCADHLVDVVTGGESPLELLFPGGSYDTVDFLYSHWDVIRYFNAILASTVARLETGGPLRILEVGAGTGGTTAHVLPRLSAASEYWFTDVSDFFLARGAERFSSHDNVTYALFDLERDPDPQGIASSSFDVVVAANVLHATADLDATLGRVRRVLAPGGVLVAFEGTHHPAWFDITTGLIDGWQLFDDRWRTDVPLLDPERWHAALREHDFEAVTALPADDHACAGLLHRVVIAQASGTRHDPMVVGEMAGADIDIDAAHEIGDLRAEIDAVVAEDRHEIMVDGLRRMIAHVLRIADPASLDRTQPLLDLGFDSLMAVEFRNLAMDAFRLEEKLPATIVFDRPTIAALADHLLDLLFAVETDTPPAVASTTPSPVPPSEVDALDDDDVEAALLAKLEELDR